MFPRARVAAACSAALVLVTVCAFVALRGNAPTQLGAANAPPPTEMSTASCDDQWPTATSSARRRFAIQTATIAGLIASASGPTPLSQTTAISASSTARCAAVLARARQARRHCRPRRSARCAAPTFAPRAALATAWSSAQCQGATANATVIAMARARPRPISSATMATAAR